MTFWSYGEVTGEGGPCLSEHSFLAYPCHCSLSAPTTYIKLTNACPGVPCYSGGIVFRGLFRENTKRESGISHAVTMTRHDRVSRVARECDISPCLNSSGSPDRVVEWRWNFRCSNVNPETQNDSIRDMNEVNQQTQARRCFGL